MGTERFVLDLANTSETNDQIYNELSSKVDSLVHSHSQDAEKWLDVQIRAASWMFEAYPSLRFKFLDDMQSLNELKKSMERERGVRGG
jgi:hypothetical protein